MFKRKNTQSVVAFALAYLLSFPAISYAITNLAASWKIPVVSTIATPVLYTSFYASLLLAVAHSMRKTTWTRLVVTLFMALSFFFTWMNDQGNSRYMWTRWNDLLNNPAYVFWLFSFSAFLLSGHIQDTQVLANTLEHFSYVSIILALLQYLAALNRNTTPEYMTFSYNILFAAAYMIVLQLSRPNWRRLAMSIIGGVLILIAGCRGALIGLLASIVVSLLFGSVQDTRKRIVYIVILIVISVVIMLLWQNLLDGLVALLDTLGIESRTVEKIATASFLEDSGRSHLIDLCMDSVGIIGRGLYGDRVILNGSYAHNLIVEVLVAYGLIAGTAVLVVFGTVIINGLHKANTQNKMIICALIAVGVVKLFFSGSFLNQEAGLYLLIGLCVNSIRKGNKFC